MKCFLRSLQVSLEEGNDFLFYDQGGRMHLTSLELHNFKCFIENKIEFNDEYTVLVGVNGAGKSSILDAAAVSLGAFVGGFDGISTNGINNDAVYRRMYKVGSRLNAEEQYPAVIAAEGNVCGQKIKWTRTKQSPTGTTTIKDAKSVTECAKRMQDAVRAGNNDLILPVVAYYGTDRLSSQKNNRKTEEKKFNRTAGYINCFKSNSTESAASEWFKMMTSIQIQEGEKIPELEAVKRAIEKCYIGKNGKDGKALVWYSVKYGEIVIKYEDFQGREELLPLSLLSDGLKITLGMVADIAYRMAVLNPQCLDKVIEMTPGVVLIDEIDMHLHPSWQKRIMEDLHYIFPKVQFIVTTHSPNILTNIKDEHILLIENGKFYRPRYKTYGRDIGDVMLETMNVNSRPDEIVKLKQDFYDAIDAEDYKKAKDKLENLSVILGEDDTDVVSARMTYDLEAD